MYAGNVGISVRLRTAMPTFAKFHGSVQGAGKGNMEKTLCRTCGKRHMIGKCPMALAFLDHPPIKEVEVSRGAAEKLLRDPTTSVTKPLTKGPKSVTQETTVTKAVTERSRPFNHKVKHCPTCRCQRVYASKAEKQKAYRDRKAFLKGAQVIMDKKVVL